MKYYRRGTTVPPDWHSSTLLAVFIVTSCLDQIPLSSILNNFHRQLNINHYLKNGLVSCVNESETFFFIVYFST